ncbi:MAG TPA: helix-turn-helix domain-containing protein [Chloroflexota bacterium]|jgi:excisionase family DNA binding protein|nr:helix-turn-helix domain-containing protein [Chloroflexota bacterium]
MVVVDAAALERAGITARPEEFARLVFAAIQEVAPHRAVAPGHGLTAEELAALRRGGVDPLRVPPGATDLAGPVAGGASRYAALLATSLSVPEAAGRLGVDESRVRQRIHARTVYAVKPGARWRLPAFQFVGDRLVPGIDRVVPRLDPALSPLTVFAWFTRPSPNLVAPDGEAWSPLDWLAAGHPVEPVAEDAASTAVGV